jgi:heterodisulfide reductase subunit C
MDKTNNQYGWKIGTLSSNKIYSTEDIKENIASDTSNLKNQTGKKIKSQHIEKKSNILEKVSTIGDSITNIKDSSKYKSKKIIINELKNLFNTNINSSNKQSSLKSEELNDEISDINETKEELLNIKNRLNELNYKKRI